jgi:hypothetical protein
MDKAFDAAMMVAAIDGAVVDTVPDVAANSLKSVGSSYVELVRYVNFY